MVIDGHRHFGALKKEKNLMRVLAIMLLLTVVVTTSNAFSAGEKAPAKAEILIGVWKITKSTQSAENVGSKWGFTKDGKFSYTDKAGNRVAANGSYDLSGDTLKIKV